MSGKFIEAKESLVDKILEQGQKLRNSMIQSILQHDPLNCDILSNNNKLYNTPVCSAASLLINKKLEDKSLLEAFLNGDYLTKEQEELALNTVRTIPSLEVCKVAENTIFKNCTCSTCTAYNENSLKCDLRRNNEFCRNSNEQCINLKFILQQVDSLKVILHTINLNSLGCKKVIHNNNNQPKSKNEITYFFEYVIPDIFVKITKNNNKSKVDSGLNKTDRAKICAKSSNDVVFLKHTFIHSISNLSNKKLEDYNLIFTIRYKEGLIQKKTLLLGIATFNFNQFPISKNLSCTKTLSIFLDKDSAISVGTLKVTLQLGAGKIYFGQEFIDAVLSSKKESSDSESFEDISDDNEQPINLKSKDENKPILKKKPNSLLEKKVPSRSKSIQKDKIANEQSQFSTVKETVPTTVQNHYQEDLLLLFGFFYVSEAQFVDFSTTSYLSCQLFCQNDSSLSKLENNSSNPLYNFCQIVPLVYDESLLLKFRENFMILEFWEKSCHSDELFGITRIPLHQFYLGYRNSIILKHLKGNRLPIIGTDWWEPIYSVDQNQLIGQVQILSALGTEEQIRNLEIERGFKDNIVKSKFPKVVETIQRNKPPSSYYTDKAKVNRKPLKPIISKKLSAVHLPIEQIKDTAENIKVDIGTQSEFVAKKIMDKSEVAPSVQMQDTLASFLKLLENRQKPSCVESSTNTDCASKLESSYIAQTSSEPGQVAAGPQLRKTSDLLESLQKALSTDSRAVSKKSEKSHNSFKVEIAINSANQLPCRRKMRSKSKKSKGKGHNNKQEENILPSTYVTFETTPEESSVHVTKVCPKSSSPKYDFKKYVQLPLSYLNDGDKRLIFKVWRKSTNTVLQPNLQSDLVLGFAALDLSVLAVGMPNIQGWFNIVDFSGKCNGQINIHVNPMEKLPTHCYTNTEEVFKAENEEIATIVEDDPNCNELLSRALKRKFTELDEITRRLRLRLSEVVSENSESDGNDDITEEFESDINSICVEEDFDLVNFEEEPPSEMTTTTDKINEEIESDLIKSKKSSSVDENEAAAPVDEQNNGNNAEIDNNNALLIENQDNTISSSEASIFNEQHLNEGKHRIDALLEKLTLISADINKPFEINRYVSGCSAVSNNDEEKPQDMQDIFRNLEQQSRPNITASNSFDPTVFDQLYGDNSKMQSGSSETSIITTFSDDRSKPDGQGDRSSEEDAKN